VTVPPVGFVGLGNMGGALAANLVQAGHAVVSHDAAGPERNVDGATFVTDVAEVARRARVVVFSLPDGPVVEEVAAEVLATSDRMCTHVVDTSTIGVPATESIAARLAHGGIAYIDAPVSGGPAGARAGTLAVMYAAPDDACELVEPVLAGLSDHRYRVGDRPGVAQAVKLANNFLSATALAATSEAVAFGQSVGVDMATMLSVLNASSGRNTATSDKFPDHVLTGRYASGFRNSLMAKDLGLYVQAVAGQGGPLAVGQATAAVWERFARTDPGADFTRIFPFVAGSSERHEDAVLPDDSPSTART
jgi:3-hydroxyisobutyrate dehydrogenase-like beta-hydroxyacid dehydrogenase